MKGCYLDCTFSSTVVLLWDGSGDGNKSKKTTTVSIIRGHFGARNDMRPCTQTDMCMNSIPA